MDIFGRIRGLRYLGLRTILGSLTYGWRRNRIERRWSTSPVSSPCPVGRVTTVTRTERGARFTFADASLEIAFLAADLVRVTWEPGVLPVPYALARTDWPVVTTSWAEDAEGWTLGTSEVTVVVAWDGGLRWRAGAAPLRDEPPPDRAGPIWVHHAQLRPDERCFGTGLRAHPFDLRGTTCEMWNREPRGAYGAGDDPLYAGIPVYLGLHGDGSYLVFFENSWRATWSFQDDATARFEGGALRYYLIPGPPARAIDRYTELTGRPAMPPRWALGFHQSRWSYMDEAEVRAVAEGFAREGLPLSAIHLDIHYMDGYRVFTVDRDRFPDLAALSGDLLAQGVRLVAILDPVLKDDPAWPLWQEATSQNLLCTTPDKRVVKAPMWPGRSAFPDFTDPAVRAWWARQYQVLVDAGIAGFWHDMNEPAAFTVSGHCTLPTPTRHAMEGRGGDHLEAHNLYGMLEDRAGHVACLALRPDRRPWLLSRAGWAGMQRYAWNWTGDSESTWWSLAQTVRMTLSMGLSGVPYTGPDIGGFGGRPSAELFVRWFQAAALLPFFRVHSAFFTPRREPWCWDADTQGILATFLRLRQSLLPYLYTLAHEAAQTGAPLVRPCFWPDAEDAALWDVDDAFLLGDALLVAPVIAQGCRRREVVLPPGRWTSWWGDGVFEGPDTVTVPAPIERIPILVREDAILPVEEDGGLVLHLFPGAQGQGEFSLFSDAGDGWEQGRLDRFRMDVEPDRVRLTRQVEGDYPWPWARTRVKVHGRVLAKGVVQDTDVGVFDELLFQTKPRAT